VPVAGSIGRGARVARIERLVAAGSAFAKSERMTHFISIAATDLHFVTGGMGSRGVIPAKPQAPTPPATPGQPSEAGNICRDAYAGTGAVAGGLLTAESGGWGAIPGAIGGGIAGRALCPQ
jgi:hypothetical protein